MGSSPFLLEGVWKEGRDGEGTTEDSHFYSSASQGYARSLLPVLTLPPHPKWE